MGDEKGPGTTVLIADIASSTTLYESLGDERARQMVGPCLAELMEAVSRHGGRVIKSMGDGLLATFDASDDAVTAAMAMCDRAEDFHVELRVGAHMGEVVEEGGDIFGDAVNTASRVAALAKPGEILVTRDLRARLPPFMHTIVQEVRPVAVRGKREPLALFAIMRDASTGTRISGPPAGFPTRTTQLEVVYLDRRRRCGRDAESLTIGRGQDCDFVLATDCTSRHHARIEYRVGKFVLIDQSANGTFLVPDELGKLFLHREEALLLGSGRIYAGADPDAEQVEPVRFRLVD